MPSTKFATRMATAAVVAAAALTVTGAVEASAAPAPQYRTLTEANQGQDLAAQAGIGLVETRRTGDAGQQWEMLFPGSAGSSDPGFGSAFQLRNRETGNCLRDNGPEARLTTEPCLPSPVPRSAQLWQHHAAIDLQSGGLDYQFVFNRKTGRVITRAPLFGSPVDAVSSPRTSASVGTGAARLQLWSFRRA